MQETETEQCESMVMICWKCEMMHNAGITSAITEIGGSNGRRRHRVKPKAKNLSVKSLRHSFVFIDNVVMMTFQSL